MKLQTSTSETQGFWVLLTRFIWSLLGGLLLFPDHFYIQEGSGLDPSWKMTLDMAFREGLRWGRDFMFTYGPLGIVSARLPSLEYGWLYLASDLFVLSQLLIVAWRLSRLITSLPTLLCGCGALLLFGWSPFYIELPILITILAFTHVAAFLRNEASVWWLGIAGLNSTAALFIKLNVGILGVMVCGAASIVPLFGGRKGRVAAIGIGWGSIALGLGVALWFLPVELGPYLWYSYQIASGFNESMGVTPPGRQPFLWCAVAVFIAWAGALAVHAKDIVSSLSKLFIAGVASLFLFVLFKQGFVRADGHELTFFTFAPMVLAIACRYLGTARQHECFAAVAVAVAAGLPIWHDHFTTQVWKGQWKGLFDYSREAREVLLEQRIPVAHPRPHLIATAEVQALIGDSSVDVIPWEQSIIYYNTFRYNPRPVMQSYTAYTPGLIEVNRKKLESETAPEFVFLGPWCIDGRFCQGEDIGARDALLRWYQVVGNANDHLLLQRRSKPRTSSKRELQRGLARLGEWVHVPEEMSAMTYLTAKFAYSLPGVARLLLYKPVETRILVRLEDGSVQDFRAVRASLATGVPISRLIGDSKQLNHLHRGRLRRLPRIEAFQITSPSSYGLQLEYSYLLESSFVAFEKGGSE
jgi:hypothetical protein